MPKIYDNVDATGTLTADITFESDNFELKSSLDNTKVLKFNQDGQPAATDVTIYSFESGAIPYESQGANLQNVTEGQVFSYTPNFAEDYQIIANHNPLSWVLVNAPTGVSITQTGLLQWSGTGSAAPPVTVTIQVTNQFLTQETDISVVITTGFSGSPTTAVQTTILNGYNDGDPLNDWQDISGNNYNLIQNTAADQPTVTFNGFNPSIPSIEFDGITDFIESSATQGADIFPSFTGEIWVVLKYTTAPVATQSVWTFGNGSNLPFKELRYDSGVGGFRAFQRDGSGSNFAVSAPYSINNGDKVIIRVYWNAGTMGVQFDKNTPAVTGSGTNLTFFGGSKFNLGKTFFTPARLNAGVGCVAMYNGNLSGAEVNDNFDYINSIWG
jgi:hypothetical protein